MMTTSENSLGTTNLKVDKLPSANRVLASEVPMDYCPKNELRYQFSEQKITKKTPALPEMVILYDYLDMNTNQIARFEIYYHHYVNMIANHDNQIIDQMEMQQILDNIFETVLSKKQFVKYNEWKK